MGGKDIFEAVQDGDLERVRELLDSGEARVDFRNKEGEYPLHRASLYGHTDVMELLIGRGTKVDAQDDNGHTALFDAARSTGSQEAVLTLLQNKADPNIANNRGSTPISMAVVGGGLDMMRIFIQYGAKLDIVANSGITLLHNASHMGIGRTNWEIIEILIDAGLKPDAESKFGTVEDGFYSTENWDDGETYRSRYLDGTEAML